MSSSASLASLFTWWMSVRFSCGRPVTIIVFVIMLQSLLMYWQRFGSASVSIFRCFKTLSFCSSPSLFCPPVGCAWCRCVCCWWSFGSSLVSSVCCLLGVGPLRFCLALLFHHIARHRPRRVYPRLSFAVSLVCLFLSGCWSPALLPGPCSPSHSAPLASWSPSQSCVCC